MSRSITRRLIAYFVVVLLIFALLTAGIYILIFRRAVMSEARENLFDRGDRIAHLLVNWSFDDSDIDFCSDETDPATAGESSLEPSRGRWGEGAGKGNASASQGQGQGQGQGKQERRGVREYRFRTDRFLTWLSQIEAGELWLIDKETETVLTATDKSVSTSELPESIDTLLARVLAGESVYSEDFGTLFGTPSMTVGLPIRDEQGEIDSALFLHTSVEEATSGLTAAWQGLLLSLVIALIIVVLLAILLSRHFIDPLKRLQRTTAKLADGDYRARTNLDMQDEIGQLGDEIDMLAERLEEAESERHFTDASRRKFLSEISHELRTPVTVIRGSLEALRDGIVKEDDVREYYATMSDSAASLDRLISDLLELTRLDNPEFTLDMEKVNLQDVVEDAVRQIRQIASQKGVKIEFNVSDEHDEFYGDYGRLRQMLVNILNNAVKFTPSGSRVFVDYRLKGAAYASQRADAVISIRDEGIGMSEETIHHLFDRFYTTGKAGTDSTGLGLSIAKGIADRHTVEIDVVSREGEGSTFTLTFPPDDRHRVT
ncbi:MAG: HAMP domain-containing histidine kinase [Clostridiaceae bacterium]|jgi:signal transduction histidine kinase|nr:HAMP domain-containing histidine kinase [Clostridia bacterium]MBP6161711.1 HAMP domain-containing histidine kinase [Clostridia bacterium]MBP6949605.1 HAMP domain-containing histidine kinase [Clostridia bacterium]NMA35483.1 HAMP domain-containing histidine kinase [Clostridiaceae bacterium]